VSQARACGGVTSHVTGFSLIDTNHSYKIDEAHDQACLPVMQVKFEMVKWIKYFRAWPLTRQLWYLSLYAQHRSLAMDKRNNNHPTAICQVTIQRLGNSTSL
jgi:hypothetical protein